MIAVSSLKCLMTKLNRTSAFLVGLTLLSYTSFAESKSTHVPKKVSPAAQQELESLATEYVLEAIELAFLEIKTNQQFIKVLMAGRSSEERAFVLKKLRDPRQIVYRKNPTTLVFEDASQVIEIDYRDIARKQVWINGRRWTVHPDRSLAREWPVWQRVLDQEFKRGRESAMFDTFLQAVWLEAEAAGKVRRGLDGLTAVERAARRAAERAQKSAGAKETDKLREEFEALKRQLETERSQPAKATAMPPGIGTQVRTMVVTGIVAGSVVEVAKDMGLTALCKADRKHDWEYIELETCAKIATSLAAAENVTASAKLTGGADDELAKKLGALFDSEKLKCRDRIPEDFVSLNVAFKLPKNEDEVEPKKIWTRASIKYDAEGKAEAGKLIDVNTGSELASYEFSSGRLIKVSVTKTQDERKVEMTESKVEIKNLIANTSDKRYLEAEKETGERKDEFMLHENIVRFVDLKQKDCAVKLVRKLEKTSSPELPAVSPANAASRAPGAID